MLGTAEKRARASSTLICKISAIDFPLYVIASVSALYLFPLHSSHSTYTSGKKFISILIVPSPSHFSHLPPATLKENLPGPYPLIFASRVIANKFLTSSNTFMYVAGLLLGVVPIENGRASCR